MEFDKSAASPRPEYFGSSLEISCRHDTTSSRVTCLTNLQMSRFGSFVAFRAGTRSISLIKMLKPIASNMRTQSFVVSIAGSLDPPRAISGTPARLTLKL